MTSSTQLVERLKFLCRVAGKELRHLQTTDRRLFDEPFGVARAARLEDDIELAERVEAFADSLKLWPAPAFLRAVQWPDRADSRHEGTAGRHGKKPWRTAFVVHSCGACRGLIWQRTTLVPCRQRRLLGLDDEDRGVAPVPVRRSGRVCSGDEQCQS